MPPAQWTLAHADSPAGVALAYAVLRDRLPRIVSPFGARTPVWTKVH